jgi:microcystin-dependent protein
MGTPFLAEVKIMSFNFAPKSWAQCNGQFLPINQNQALFALLGTQYGGNGQTTFALPNLRGQVAMHFGAGFIVGQQGGSESVTLNQSQMPQHQHIAQGVTEVGDVAPFATNYMAGLNNGWRAPSALVNLHPQTIQTIGGSQPHENMSPYLVLNFCIALQGIFPSQN